MSISTHDSCNIASMTGYGRFTGETALGRVTVEVRSLNHRHLDVIVRSPRSLMHLEPEIKGLVRDLVSRGKVEIFLVLEDRLPDLEIDSERALEVARALGSIASAIGDRVRLEHILTAGDIVKAGEIEIDEGIASGIIETVKRALENMVQHRLSEGRALAEDLVSRVSDLTGITGKIEMKAPEASGRARLNITRFLEEMELGERMEPQRLEMEVAMMAQRADITEEILRLRTHQESFREILSGGGVIGRRLDFLIQEIHREINTIGSKSAMGEISQMVVDFKTELEKIREQVQNIE